jgi:2,3-bisphosphoglycerate-dependent phosphoglycerate mutase
MNNTFIFIRHAETKKDGSIPVSCWELTDRATIECRDFFSKGIFDDVDVIISLEKKAVETVKPLSKRFNKGIIKIRDLSEVSRDKGKMLRKKEYDEAKKKIFRDLDYKYGDWETANFALERFRRAIDDIDSNYESKKIIVSTRGTVMTLYFSYLQNDMGRLFERWKGLSFLDYGIVKNKKVVLDLI